jgi:glycosyltransferase involved in cell wall biosynthesis
MASGANVTVFASSEEGFGLPVVESMACGTPVACSNVAALPEVGATAATYFDPNDVDSMACTIVSLIESEDVWRQKQALGFVEQLCRASSRDLP